MRLVHRQEDGSFNLTKYFVREDEIPPYAVLSHTWLTETDEVNYNDMSCGLAHLKVDGYRKIQFCCDQAAKDGLQYFWIDACCINRASSEELSEAINSMYRWYHNATECFAYLTDVSATEAEVVKLGDSEPWMERFRKSRWHTRGWTLQELLAPPSVDFFSVEGTWLGSKNSLQKLIHEATGIPDSALKGAPLATFTVAERMSWAKYRQTTRIEDKAYCLLGIFEVFMPHVYGEGDHAFVRLQEEIDKKNKKHTETDGLLETLKTVPSAAFNSRDNEGAPTCLPDTRVELLQHIELWVNSVDEKSIFWLNGIAGTGKSTVARTVARRYHEQGKLGGSFFFSRGGGNASHANHLVTTLASQLASQIPPSNRHIREAIAAHKDIAEKSLRDQWDQLIIGPLSRLDSTSYSSAIVLVLDALDECDSERDIRIILRLLALTRDVRNVRLRVFITSRPETPIRGGFRQIPASERAGFVLHDISPTLVDRDLTLFFEDNFTNIRQERGWDSTWPGRTVISRLVEISCGLFIWASTACRYIREGKHFAKKRISRLLHGHKSGGGPERQLDQIYVTVLKDSIPPTCEKEEKLELLEDLRLVLGSIVILLSPLSTMSLAALLSVEKNSITEALGDLHPIFNIPTQSDRPIRLHHPTFRDFILDKARCSDADFLIDEKNAHRALAESCIQLMCRMLKPNICCLESPGTVVRDIDRGRVDQYIPPELRYACLYWAEHCRQSGMHLCDDDTVHLFLQQHFLHWLEVISLVGKGSEMAAVIRMYQSLLVPVENPAQLPFVKDSRRFMFAFQSIIEKAPLQIYGAALAFIRSSNLLRHHFWNHTRAWIKDFRIVEPIAPEVKDEYNYVNDLAFTPDGRQVASGSIDEFVRVWDVATRTTLNRFEGLTDKVSSVAISPDGKFLAAGSDDTTIMLWDMKTKATRFILTGHTRWVNTVVFSFDGRLLASGSMDETIRLWNVATGKEVKNLQANSSCVNSIAFSPEGSLLASGTVDQMIRLWDLQKAEIRLMLDGHSGPVNSVRFSPDGKRIVSGSDDMTIRIWDAKMGTTIMTLRGHFMKVWAVTFSRDGQRVASGSEDKTIRLWSTTTGELRSTLTGHTSGVNAVAYSPSGQFLVSCAFNDEVMLWDAMRGESLGQFDDFSAQSLSGGYLAAKLAESLIDEQQDPPLSEVSTITRVDNKAHSSTVTCLIATGDGTLVASGSDDTTIKLWRQGGREHSLLEGHTSSISHLSFSPNERLIASASVDTTAKLWDRASETVSYTLSGHTGAIQVVRFSFDGHLLATCSTDKTVRLWDVGTGAVLSIFKGHLDTVNDLAFSPNGHRIASCSADSTIRFWNILSTVQDSGPLLGHTESVNSIAFSPDGTLVVSSSSDTSLKIWQTSGHLLCTLTGHTSSVNSAAFSPSMERVVSCSEDMLVVLWKLDTKLMERVIEVDVIIRHVSFSTDGEAINTDRGVLACSPTMPARNNSTLFVAQEWLRKDEENVLWLPKGYHATTVTISGGLAVLGHDSGAISFAEIQS